MVHFMVKQGTRAYNVNSRHKPRRMSVSDDDNFMISLRHRRHTILAAAYELVVCAAMVVKRGGN